MNNLMEAVILGKRDFMSVCICKSLFLPFFCWFVWGFFQSPCAVFWLPPGMFTLQRHVNIYNFKRRRNNARFLLGVLGVYFSMIRGLGSLLFKFFHCIRTWKVWAFCLFTSQSPEQPPLHFHHFLRDATSYRLNQALS